MESNTNTSEHGKSTPNNDADDVPGDFFDDFLKDDFMAGLDIVDEAGDDDEHLFPLVDKSPTVSSAKESPNKLPPNGNDAKSPNYSTPEKQKNTDGPKSAPAAQKKAASPKSGLPEHKNDAGPKPRPSEQKNVASPKSGPLAKWNKNFRSQRGKPGPNAQMRQIRVLSNRRFEGDEPRSDRRDPKKTIRDIERDKVKCEKDKEKKIITEKLMVVETGLVPPGLEMEFDMEKRLSDPVDRGKVTSSPRRLSKHRYSSERLRKRSFSPRRNRGRSPPRRSPVSRRRRSPLEPRYKRSRYSPGRHRSRSYSPARPKKREEKKSFLEELAEKLNEMKPAQHIVPQALYPPPDMSYAPVPVPNMMAPVRMPYYPNKTYVAPAPVPAPLTPAPPPMTPAPQYRPEMQHLDPYDRNYFIGETTNPFMMSQQGAPVQYASVPREVQPMTVASFTPVVEKKLEKETTSDAAVQLYHEKKITLSQFLSTAVKEAENPSSTPVDLREKVKVISRCQDAIKYLDFVEKRFSGCLVTYKDQTPAPEKHKSPLLRASQCKIPYTEPSSSSARPEAYSDYIDRLLRTLGLLEKPVDVPKAAAEPMAPPAPSITRADAVATSNECGSCLERKRKTFKSTMTQCDSALTFSVGTQVSDEDFKFKLKSQSLASLTPAQLLSEMGQGSNFRNDLDSGFKMGMGQRKPYQQQPQYGMGQGRSYNPFLE